MQRFIIKISVIIGFSMAIYILCFYIIIFVLRSRIDKSMAIILGDSHTEHIDIPNTFNYSFPGAPYILHYNFLEEFKHVLSNKLVIVSFSANNISNYKTYRFNNLDFRPDWIFMVNSRLNSFNMLPNPSYSRYKWYDNGINSLSVEKFRSLLHNVTVNSQDIFIYETDRVDAVISKHFSSEIYNCEDTYEKEYLLKMLELLNQLDCKVILLNTLKSKHYNNAIPEDYSEQYRALRDDVLNQYPNVTYIDLNNHPLIHYKEEFLKDPDHTNITGDSVTIQFLLRNVYTDN